MTFIQDDAGALQCVIGYATSFYLVMTKSFLLEHSSKKKPKVITLCIHDYT